jgi:hypothetical protein
MTLSALESNVAGTSTPSAFGLWFSLMVGKVGPEKGDDRSIELLMKACAIKARLVPADLRSDARQFAGTRSDKAEMPCPRDDVIFGLGGERVIDRLREVGVSEDRVVCAAPQLDRDMNIRKAGLSEGRPQGGRSDDRGLDAVILDPG